MKRMGGHTAEPRRPPRDRKPLREILRDRSGAAAVIVGLAMPVLAGMGLLGVDAAVWYSERRNLQTAVDAAALAGALHHAYGYGVSSVTAIATRDAIRNGFDPTNGAISVNRPPSSGPGAGDPAAVEVVLTENLPLFYSKVLGENSATVTVRATASTVIEDEFCILALDPTLDSAVNVAGNAMVTMSCGIAVNSNSALALDIAGSVELTASTASITGQMHVDGSPSITFSEPPKSGQPPVADPYTHLDVPAFAGCDHTNAVVQNAETLTPGVYCGGLRANAGAVVDLEPGVYILAGGEFHINGGATVRGTDVTFLLTDDTSGDFTTVNIAGGANMELSAPASGNWAGILFYQDRDAPSYQGSNVVTNTFTGGADMSLEGAVYFPSQAIEFTGNANVGSQCLQLVGKQVIMTGASELANNCAASGTEDIGVARVKLLR